MPRRQRCTGHDLPVHEAAYRGFPDPLRRILLRGSKRELVRWVAENLPCVERINVREFFRQAPVCRNLQLSRPLPKQYRTQKSRSPSVVTQQPYPSQKEMWLERDAAMPLPGTAPKKSLPADRDNPALETLVLAGCCQGTADFAATFTQDTSTWRLFLILTLRRCVDRRHVAEPIAQVRL